MSLVLTRLFVALFALGIMVPAAWGAELKPGIYVAARDLDDGVFIGTHQFLVLVPADPAEWKASERLEDLGDGTLGIIVGAQKDGKLLKVAWFQDADLKATQEYTNPKKYVKLLKPDFDFEQAAVKYDGELSDAIKKVLAGVRQFETKTKAAPVKYPSPDQQLANGGNLLNSNSWAQSVIEYAIGADRVREDFTGADNGHSNRFPRELFVP